MSTSELAQNHETYKELVRPRSLHAAMFAIQSNVRGVEKDADNPHFGSKYASLSKVWETLRPQFTAHGLLVTISPGKLEEKTVPVTLRIVHVESEESETHVMAMPVAKLDPQGYASAITYSSRYLLMTVFGLPPHDDDGQAAGGMSPEEVQNYETALAACESLPDLKALFSQAYRAAGSDAAAIKTLSAAKDQVKRRLECEAMVDKHYDSLLVVRDGLQENRLEEAAEAWLEIPNADRIKLNLAPSKGGWLSTKERSQMKSNEFTAALRTMGAKA